MSVVVQPAGATLPPSFLAQDWNMIGNSYRDTHREVAPLWCLQNVSGITCDAWVMDLDADGAQEVLLFANANHTVHLFRLGDQTTWVHAGSWSLPSNCPRIVDEMAAGRFVTVRPQPRRWPDLEISGMRFQLLENDPIPVCPN